MAPGADVWVRDTYALGAGSLRAAVLGLVTVADMRDSAELARGKLMRYLAEAAWYPTAPLPSQGVRWEGMDDTSARATLCDGTTTVTLEFRFGTDGLIVAVWAASRPRSISRACAESLASENASRLMAMDRADRDIDRMLVQLHDDFDRLRQSVIDEELSNVIAGFKAQRESKGSPHRKG